MFKSELDRRLEVVHEILHGLELLGGASEDHEDFIYEYLPERDCPDEGFPGGFFVTVHEEVGIWWRSLGSHCCPNKLDKIPVNE